MVMDEELGVFGVLYYPQLAFSTPYKIKRRCCVEKVISTPNILYLLLPL